MSQRLDIILRVTRLILFFSLFNLPFTPTREKEKKLLLPITSEIKVLCRPPRTRSIFRLFTLSALSHVYSMPARCISFNKSRSYYERSLYRLLKFSTERERARQRKRNRENERHESSLTVSFLTRLLNFI